MEKILFINLFCIKRETVSVTNPLINKHDLKGSRLLDATKWLPRQLLSLRCLRRIAYHHFFHCHHRVQHITLSGSIGTVNRKRRQQGLFCVRMNQISFKSLILGRRKTDYGTTPDLPVTCNCTLTQHKWIPPTCSIGLFSNHYNS